MGLNLKKNDFVIAFVIVLIIIPYVCTLIESWFLIIYDIKYTDKCYSMNTIKKTEGIAYCMILRHNGLELKKSAQTESILPDFQWNGQEFFV